MNYLFDRPFFFIGSCAENRGNRDLDLRNAGAGATSSAGIGGGTGTGVFSAAGIPGSDSCTTGVPHRLQKADSGVPVTATVAEGSRWQ